MSTRTSTRAPQEPPRQRRHRLRHRLATLTGVAALALGIGVASLAGAQPANAAIWDFCKPDTTFAAPLAAGGTSPEKATVKQTSVGSPNATVAMKWVPTADATTGVAYGGGGLTWTTFGTSCADLQISATTMVGNFLFQCLAEFPARVLGLVVLLVFNFGTLITDTVIGDGTPAHMGVIGPLVNQLHQNLFTAWAPLFIGAGLVVALWNVARKRSQKGMSDFGWLMGVIVVMGILASPSGIALLRKTNDVTQEITVCALFSSSGACGSDQSMTSLSDLSNSMVETLDAPIWGAGALGGLATTYFAAPLHTDPLQQITLQAHDDVPNIHSDNQAPNKWQITVPIPVDAIPKSGTVLTFGDVWRWTGTYTRSEMAAIRDNPSLACSNANSPDITALTKSNGTNMDLGDKGGQLCAFKWMVRAAVISYVIQNYPGAYGDLSGQGTTRISAGMSGLGVTPLATGISIVGFMTLFYQFELIFLFLISPIVGLLSLRNPQVATKWFGQIGASLVKRVAAGLVMGLVLWLVGVLQASILDLASSTGAALAIPPFVYPFVTATICVLVMLTGFILMGRIRDMILGGMRLPEGDAVESGAKKLLGIGVSAAAGAFSAGSGLALKGAGQALLRSGAIGGSEVRQGFMVGDRAGRSVRAADARLAQDEKREASRQKQQAAERAAWQRTAPTLPGGGHVPAAQPGVQPGPGAAAGQDAQAAWEALLQTSAARQRRSEELRPARERVDSAAASMRRAEADTARFAAARDELVRQRTADHLAAGDDPELAAKRATAHVDGEADRLGAALLRARQELGDATVHLDVAQRTPGDWARSADAHLRAGSSFAEAQAALHMDTSDAYAWQQAAAQMRRPQQQQQQ